VVPVAFLLQGETVLIFWGNENVLIYAVIGLALLSALLIRLGLSHFQREYLLGREIDTLNFKSMWRMFIRRVTGDATSIFEWYAVQMPAALRELKQPLFIVAGIALVSICASYIWVVRYVPTQVEITPERVELIHKYVGENLGNLDYVRENLPAPWIFMNNTRAMVGFLFAGMISFSTLGLALFVFNMALIGGILGGASLISYSPLGVFAALILPHGLFELTAVFISTAAVLRMGAVLVAPQPDKSLGDVFLLSLADWFRVFIGLVIPLLAIAALVEVYVTPEIFELAYPYL
jgi:uncharacterized membrane protein SpoIIM required for sporulation